MDEILEGYRTFTALAAEVNSPGGSGIMSRYGTEPATRSSSSSSSSTSRPRGGTLSSNSGTLQDYAPVQKQQQQRGGGSGQQLARGAGEKQAKVGALARQEGGRRGQGVPYIDPASDPVMMDALRLLFAKEGNYVQDLVRVSKQSSPCNASKHTVGVAVWQQHRRAARTQLPYVHSIRFYSIRFDSSNGSRHEVNSVALNRAPLALFRGNNCFLVAYRIVQATVPPCSLS